MGREKTHQKLDELIKLEQESARREENKRRNAFLSRTLEHDKTLKECLGRSVSRGDRIPPFPSKPHRHDGYGKIVSEEFEVPDEGKKAAFEKHYGGDMPQLDAVLFDPRALKSFAVRDCKLIRQRGMILVVSPYYYESGPKIGQTLMECIPPDELELAVWEEEITRQAKVELTNRGMPNASFSIERHEATAAGEGYYEIRCDCLPEEEGNKVRLEGLSFRILILDESDYEFHPME